jgi:hypothetical protein
MFFLDWGHTYVSNPLGLAQDIHQSIRRFASTREEKVDWITRFRKQKKNIHHADDEGGAMLAWPVFALVLLFSISTAVMFGTHLALNVYAGHSAAENTQLIEEQYEFLYSWPRFRFPLFDMDISKAIGAIKHFFGLFTLPSLDWGPENYSQLGRSGMTLNSIVGIIKGAIYVLFVVLFKAHVVHTRAITTAEAATGHNMRTRQEHAVDGPSLGTAAAAETSPRASPPMPHLQRKPATAPSQRKPAKAPSQRKPATAPSTLSACKTDLHSPTLTLFRARPGVVSPAAADEAHSLVVGQTKAKAKNRAKVVV